MMAVDASEAVGLELVQATHADEAVLIRKDRLRRRFDGRRDAAR
jgi:hypothetical protein